LSAVEKLNPKLNAVLQTLPEQAAAEIRDGLPPGPFKGVPFLIKELLLHARNVPCDMGSRLARGFVSPEDTVLMSRFRRAGLVLIGTTQTPEFGYGPSAETVLHGPVHNPWDLTRSAGGSSSGSGAAVAAGIVPIAYGNDGGGSIRLPASCNGLVGLKPTRDRIPPGPDCSDPVCGHAIEFALTRSVRDAAALLDAVGGADVGAPGHPVPPSRPYLEEVGTQPGRLRIAWTTTPASEAKIDPECEKAVRETVRLLEDLGHTLVEDRPRYDWDAYVQSLHVIWSSSTAFAIDALAAALGRKPGAHNLEVGTLACYEDGKRFSRSGSSQGHGIRKYDLSPGRSFFSERGRAGHTDHRQPAGAARRTQPKSEEHDGHGMDATGLCLCPLHPDLQHDGSACFFTSPPLESRRSAGRHTNRRALWR